MARWACVLHLSLTVALVPQIARRPSHVVRSGAAYDYCIQSLGCTAAEAGKVERSLVADAAKYMTYTKAVETHVWLQSTLDLSDSELKKVVMRFPTLLCLSVEANMAPKLDWLQKRLDLGDAQLRKLVLRFPSLLGKRVDAVEPKLEWLRTRLELDDTGLRKIVLTHPPLLGYSVEANIAPTLDWLQTRLDLDAAQLRKIVLKLPSLLSYSSEGNMASKFDWLQTRLNLDVGQLKKVVLGHPSLLGYSVVDNLAPKLEWLQTRLELDDEQLGKMVVRISNLLGFSVEDNMEPKLGFFEEELGLSASEVRSWIVSSPSRLGQSLKNRYRPRLEVCRAAGADPAIVRTTAASTDEQFCKRLNVPLEVLREASGAPSMSPAAAVPSKPQRWHQDKVPSSWALAELRPWQLEVNEMIQEPANNTGIWLFDSQTYWGGRGKNTFFKHLMATTDDVCYAETSSSCNVEAKQIQFAIEYTRDVSKQTRAMCYRLPRADPHNACFYEVLGAVAPETHIVVAGSFWPDLRLLPNRRWRLFEWDDQNNIHELPPGTDPGGRVGVGNTNSEDDYLPYWNRNREGDKAS